PTPRGAGLDLKGASLLSADLAGGLLVTTSAGWNAMTTIATVDVTGAAGPTAVSSIDQPNMNGNPINSLLAVDPAHVAAAIATPGMTATQLHLFDVGPGGALTDAHQLQITGAVDGRSRMDIEGTTLRVLTAPADPNGGAIGLHAIAL